MTYNAKTTVAPLSTKNAEANKTYTVKRAPHDIKGAINVVIKRSPSLLKVRAAITEGTLQPKPTISGTNAFPGKPSARIMRSIINAPRAIKPTSSKNDRDKNNAAITGIKLATS